MGRRDGVPVHSIPYYRGVQKPLTRLGGNSPANMRKTGTAGWPSQRSDARRRPHSALK